MTADRTTTYDARPAVALIATTDRRTGETRYRPLCSAPACKRWRPKPIADREQANRDGLAHLDTHEGRGDA